MKNISLLLTFPVLSLAAGQALAVNCIGGLPARNPDAIYTDHGDGTLTDTRTQLMWDKCVWGREGNDCASGSAAVVSWSSAMNVAALANAMNDGAGYKGYNDWRLPNIKELESLVESCRANPSINDTLFPNTPAYAHWSSSPSSGKTDAAWEAHFTWGGVYANGIRGASYNLRLVRSGNGFAAYDGTDLDSDDDGLLDSVENAAPNNGDGNGDGTADRLQPRVASLPRDDGGYLTLTTTCANGLTEVATYPENHNGSGSDPLYTLPYGVVEFRSECESGQFTVYYHGVSSIAGMTYRKFGPVIPGVSESRAWYTLPGMTPGTVSLNGQTVATATFTLSDNALGDDTGNDGVIVDQGGPGNGNGGASGTAQPIPALGPLGLTLLSGLLGLAALGRRRRT